MPAAPPAPLDLAFADLDVGTRYKLMSGLVIPRPIALVTSVGRDGVTNAAPFSYFNVFSEDPPLVVLGLQARADGGPKDTARNIRATGEFVVNLVDEALAEGMNVCAVDFPPEEGEIDAAGLTLAPSSSVAPARIEEAPVAFECKVNVVLAFNAKRDLVVGEVLHVHARPGIVEPGTFRVDTDAYRPIGRFFGNFYSYQRELFQLKRETHAEWRERRGGEG
ncbi:MAG: flavin reductase family protein [Geminicoccaceae bacterium]|nr:flavin reductase family protein [Geminicoccaceae bacterium]